MGVVADERRLNPEVAQELAGVAGIFRGDEVRLFQHPKGPEGDVLQVADGGGDDVERADGAHLKMRCFSFPSSRLGTQLPAKLCLATGGIWTQSPMLVNAHPESFFSPGLQNAS